MIRARPENNDVQDDSINIAGWVFADLLLSLAIIFLVSISFSVPERSGNSLSSEIQIAGQNELRRSDLGEQPVINKGFNFYYSKFDKIKLQSDLRDFFLRNGMDPNSEVIYAQVVGGFNSSSEGSDLGTLRALEFSIALKRADLEAFSKTNYDLTTSGQLNPNQVALRLSFVPPLIKAN